MPGHCQVAVAAPSVEEADHLARLAVERRLAACAQVSGPVTSTYWWQGAVEVSPEWICTMKTAAERVGELLSMLKEAHSYEVPEIIVTDIPTGDPAYLAWIEAETALDR